MIITSMLGKVRRLHLRDGLSISEIDRRTGLTRKTIRKWLKAPDGVEPKYRRRSDDTKTAPYGKPSFQSKWVLHLPCDAVRTTSASCRPYGVPVLLYDAPPRSAILKAQLLPRSSQNAIWSHSIAMASRYLALLSAPQSIGL